MTVVKNDSFKDFVVEQLAGVTDLSCRAMFGGYGLYSAERFFGIIHRGILYFKTNQQTVGDFVEAGMKPFRPNKKQTLTSYYEVPADVLEDRRALTEWAQRALDV